MKNFVTSGKKGDLIMSLYIVKSMGGGNLFITQGEFEESLESVIESCGKLITSQDYVNSFQIHSDEPIDVNLDACRKSRDLFRITLLEIMCRAHQIQKPQKVGPWISVPGNDNFDSKVVLHRRSMHHVVGNDRANPLFDWDKLLDVFGAENCVFVSRIESEWLEFEHPEIEYYCPADNYEHAAIIKGSKFYIGNQSFPSALADALGVNRIFELATNFDRKHFAINYADNAWYYANPWDATIKNFRYLKNKNNAGYIDLVTDEFYTGKLEKYRANWKKVLIQEINFQWAFRKLMFKQFGKAMLGL